MNINLNKFIHFHEVHHLLIDVHLVPLLSVHLDRVALVLEKHSLKFGHSILYFQVFYLL